MAELSLYGAAINLLCLVQAVDGFCLRIVVAVALVTNGRLDSGLDHPIGMVGGNVVRASIRVVINLASRSG